MKILFVCTCFSPKNVIGSIRTSKFVKYLLRLNENLTIISPTINNYDIKDESLECYEFTKAKRITIDYSKLTKYLTEKYLENKKSKVINNKTKSNNLFIIGILKVRSILRFIFAKWRDWEWKFKVIRHINKENEKYDIVISSSPLTCTHYIAMYLKKNGIAKQWVADFRDPIIQEDAKGISLFWQRRDQYPIAHYADIITIVTKHHADNFDCFAEDRTKVHFLPNGFDEDDLSKFDLDNSTNANNRLIITYAGGLYGGKRDCSPLFKVIYDLIQEKLISKDDIIFKYAGYDFQILYEQANNFNLDTILKNQGILTREESIKLQHNSDCIVVATYCYKDGGGELTGKIFEPIMLNKKIILLVNGNGKNSEPAQFVKKINAGIVFEESNKIIDFLNLKQYILNICVEKKNKGHLTQTKYDEEVKKYTHKYIIDELIKLIHDSN